MAELLVRVVVELSPEIQTLLRRAGVTVPEGLAAPDREEADAAVPLWSDARLAVLRRDWPTTRHILHIQKELNALDGPELGRHQIAKRATHLGLSRPKRARTEGSDLPVPAQASRGRPSSLSWPNERQALLRQEWLAGTSTREITVALNRLPGPALVESQVGNKATRLGLKRPPSDTWSADRLAVLREVWPTNMALDQVEARINALPGPVLNIKQITGHANYRGLFRDRSADAAPAPEADDASGPLGTAAAETLLPCVPRAPFAREWIGDRTIEPLPPNPADGPLVPAEAGPDADDGVFATTFDPLPYFPCAEPPAPEPPPAPPAPARSGVVGQFRQALADEKAKRPTARLEPVDADLATIRAWAAPRGLASGNTSVDLFTINNRRVALGLAPFRHVGPGGLSR